MVQGLDIRAVDLTRKTYYHIVISNDAHEAAYCQLICHKDKSNGMNTATET